MDRAIEELEQLKETFIGLSDRAIKKSNKYADGFLSEKGLAYKQAVNIVNQRLMDLKYERDNDQLHST